MTIPRQVQMCHTSQAIVPMQKDIPQSSRRLVCGVWALESGVWRLEFGAWSLAPASARRVRYSSKCPKHVLSST